MEDILKLMFLSYRKQPTPLVCVRVKNMDVFLNFIQNKSVSHFNVI